jgi:hypothetical protein
MSTFQMTIKPPYYSKSGLVGCDSGEILLLQLSLFTPDSSPSL